MELKKNKLIRQKMNANYAFIKCQMERIQHSLGAVFFITRFITKYKKA